MATRSKKSKILTFLKPVVFLAAVAFAVVAVLETFANAWELQHGMDGVSVYAQDALRGVKPDEITRLWAFANENETLLENALQRFLYGDGSKEAYETYQQHRKEVTVDRLKPAREAILANCKGESGHGSPAAIFAYHQASLVNLRKLGEHEKHFVPEENELEVNEYGVDLTYDLDGQREIDSRIYQYDSSVFYGDTYDSAEMSTTFFAAPTALPDLNGSDYAYQSKSEPPQEIKDRLKEGEIAVELCRTRYANSNNLYDGYYALSVNETMLYSRYSSHSTNYGSAFKSYAEYLDAYDNMRQLTDQYKNMQFAVVDNKTGYAVSNVADLDGKKLTKDDLRPFTKSEWNYRINLLTGELTLSDAAENDSRRNSYLDSQSLLYFLQTGEVDATMYVTFDRSLPAQDAFSDHAANYAKVAETVQSTLESDLLFFLGLLACTVFLMLTAGEKSSVCDDKYGVYHEVRLKKTDRIFTGLRTILNLGAAVALGGIAVMLLEDLWDEGESAAMVMLAGVGACTAGIAALLLDWLMYLARHIKNGTLFSNFFLVWLWKKCRAFAQKKKAALAARPKVVRDLLNDILRRVLFMGFLPNLVMGILIVLQLVPSRMDFALVLIFALFAYDVFLAFYICRYAYHLRTVIAAVHKMRGGDLHVEIDTLRMPPAVKAFADNVTELQRGLQAAVEQAIRDERTKTELITNVSHDLKTPLTSIISYVDLLQRCNIEDKTAQEYLRVLGEKSDRLKKLIEDLVEASKASAGAIKTELTTVSLNELAAQIAGEYADAFAARALTLIVKGDEDPIPVRADGKLSYRVLDNLMGNIKKYAMPGTRVYLTLERQNDRGVLVLRNISEQPLDISVDELRERFVRGDRARSTEGSGLGLSIAEDLCRLQGAELTLSVEGDLFTASVAFPLG